MPGPPKVPDAEWTLYKAHIRSLYITENKTLGQMMERVASEYGFRPRSVATTRVRPLLL